MTCENEDIPAVLLSQSDAEAAVLCLINEERAALGVPPLTLNLILQKVARDQALAASAIKWWPSSGDSGHIPHVNPITHKDEQVRIKEAGYCPSNPNVIRNENAYSSSFTGDPSTYATGTTPKAAVDWWINSPDHFATLKDPRYRETGVGVIHGTASQDLPAGSDGAIFVQCFGGCEKVTPAVNTQLWAWGADGLGELGDASAAWNQNAPVHPTDFESFIAVAASYHSVGVKADGTVWTWGPRENKGPTSGGSDVPVKVVGLDKVTAVAAGYEHNLAIRNDGTVWAWGDNRYGQLGDGSGSDQVRPVQVRGLTGVQAVAAGDGHSVALRADGSVWTWGGNGHGQLGIGSFDNQPFPVQVAALTKRSIAIAAGGDRTMVIEEDTGQIWLWGWNIGYSLGVDMPPIVPSGFPPVTRPHDVVHVWLPIKPVRSGAFTGANIIAIGAGYDTSYAVDNRGHVWAWGDNRFSQFGVGPDIVKQDLKAHRVHGLSDIMSLSAGSYHCLALGGDGTLWSWGSNGSGQVGQALVIGPDAPPGQVARLDHVSAYSAGHQHSLAIGHRPE
jgi:alpha-tubulin suppressor-like RCC1 family protein/uncharacterized protein YkwD